MAPSPGWCARQGGGGDDLSNESAYRNTVLRDTFGLSIPAGHIPVPAMTNLYGGTATSGGGTRDDNRHHRRRFEACRTAAVGQGKSLILIVGTQPRLQAISRGIIPKKLRLTLAAAALAQASVASAQPGNYFV